MKVDIKLRSKAFDSGGITLVCFQCFSCCLFQDESDSDIESGFESDVIVPKKSKSSVKKGRGRPKKQVSESDVIVPKKSKSSLKKVRGQPKKQVCESYVIVPKKSKSSVKKGRGRPKKHVYESDVIVPKK